MQHSLAFTETFLASLNSFPVQEIRGNFGKNWTPSQPLLPCLDPILMTLNFSNGIKDLSCNALDNVKSIKSLVKENCSLLKKGKVLNDWKCLLDYPNIVDHDTLTVFTKSVKGPLVETLDLGTARAPTRESKPDNDLNDLDSKEFLRELNLLLEKYKMKKSKVIHLLQKD